MTREMHLLGESIQEVTLYAWPIVYNDNKYDMGGAATLEMLRDWAEEFENWWESHDEDWICEHDYLEECYAFTGRKAQEFIEEHQN